MSTRRTPTDDGHHRAETLRLLMVLRNQLKEFDRTIESALWNLQRIRYDGLSPKNIMTMSEMRDQYALEVYHLCGNNKMKAARVLNIGVRTVYDHVTRALKGTVRPTGDLPDRDRVC